MPIRYGAADEGQTFRCVCSCTFAISFDSLLQCVSVSYFIFIFDEFGFFILFGSSVFVHPNSLFCFRSSLLGRCTHPCIFSFERTWHINGYIAVGAMCFCRTCNVFNMLQIGSIGINIQNEKIDDIAHDLLLLLLLLLFLLTSTHD